MATKEPEELNTSTIKDMEETGINENPKMENPDAQKQTENTQAQEPEIQKDSGDGTRTKRDRKLTEKGEEYHAQIREMKEKAFARAYKKFKQVIVYIRNELKKECREDQRYLFLDTITDEAAKAIEFYDTCKKYRRWKYEHLSTASRHHRSLYEGPDHFH